MKTKLFQLAIISSLLIGAKECNDCQKKQAEAVAICQAQGPTSAECIQAQKVAEEACKVEPTPPPTPAPECLPNIPWCQDIVPPASCSSATVPCKHNPTTDPNHCELAPNCPPIPPEDPCQGVHCERGKHCVNGECVDIPDPCDNITCAPGYICLAGKCSAVSTSCPKTLAPGSVVYLNNKRYGNGLDSTVRVKGDPVFCQMIHGVAVNDCHLEGWAKRSACEMELLSGCPIWNYSVNGTSFSGRCLQAPSDPASCDHFGDPVTRDDPQTPEFEGNPPECGKQRDNAGDPTAGFFMVGHGNTYFQACKPDGTGCGPWIAGKDKK